MERVPEYAVEILLWHWPVSAFSTYLRVLSLLWRRQYVFFNHSQLWALECIRAQILSHKRHLSEELSPQNLKTSEQLLKGNAQAYVQSCSWTRGLFLFFWGIVSSSVQSTEWKSNSSWMRPEGKSLWQGIWIAVFTRQTSLRSLNKI